MIGKAANQRCAGLRLGQSRISPRVFGKSGAAGYADRKGRHCNYGSTKSHESGWVQAGESFAGAASVHHLKRLLIMFFRKAVPAPVEAGTHPDGEPRWKSEGFCMECGEPDTEAGIDARATRGKSTSWHFHCAQCQARSNRTHCYSCRTASLFKNGTRWTYHNTVADQITNVLCPQCGAYFDADWDIGDR